MCAQVLVVVDVGLYGDAVDSVDLFAVLGILVEGELQVSFAELNLLPACGGSGMEDGAPALCRELAGMGGMGSPALTLERISGCCPWNVMQANTKATVAGKTRRVLFMTSPQINGLRLMVHLTQFIAGSGANASGCSRGGMEKRRDSRVSTLRWAMGGIW